MFYFIQWDHKELVSAGVHDYFRNTPIQSKYTAMRLELLQHKFRSKCDAVCHHAIACTISSNVIYIIANDITTSIVATRRCWHNALMIWTSNLFHAQSTSYTISRATSTKLFRLVSVTTIAYIICQNIQTTNCRLNTTDSTRIFVHRATMPPCHHTLCCISLGCWDVEMEPMQANTM